MEDNKTVAKLREAMPEIRERFGVKELAVFGSVARGNAGADSDVDVLVRFREAATLRGFMGLKFYLEEVLGRKVDLVTEKALRSEMRPHVEEEAVYVA